MIRYILECSRYCRELLQGTLILSLGICIELRELRECLELVGVRDRHDYLSLILVYCYLTICYLLECNKIHHDSEDQYESSNEWDLVGETDIN